MIHARLVLVGPLPPPAAGMANQTEQLARLLRDEGIALTVVPTNAAYRPAWVGRIRGLRAFARLFGYALSLRQALRGAHLVHVMANSGWSWHFRAAPAIWAAHRAGVPVVVNYRGGGAEAFFARSFRWVRPTLARADAVVVPSGFLEAVFRRHGIATEIVPNVIDLDRFRAAPRPDPGAAPRILVARNLEPIYDIATAIRAFASVRRQLPGARLVVAGAGSLRDELGRLAGELSVSDAVEFTGSLDNARMAARYREADLVLNPSLVDNMPISILEALASGVPVVSTNVGGIPFMVGDGRTGLLVGPGDPEAMAAAAVKVLADPDLAARLRTAGMAVADGHTWPAVRERLLAVYERVLGRPVPRPAGALR
ncbi:MAG TPA: glycosyltransferase family 4 protein [Candidatus Limnocylindrales bacterium]|nr:glycosyltransferase family 4 protein [Candidatus Limnocylindrales bacterium]